METFVVHYPIERWENTKNPSIIYLVYNHLLSVIYGIDYGEFIECPAQWPLIQFE